MQQSDIVRFQANWVNLLAVAELREQTSSTCGNIVLIVRELLCQSVMIIDCEVGHDASPGTYTSAGHNNDG